MSTKYFSLESLNGMCTEEKCLLVIQDSVYDITSYLKQHPGGMDILLECGGLDCTEEFENIGHSNDAKKLLKDLKIGEIEESERKPKNIPNEPKSGILGWFGL